MPRPTRPRCPHCAAQKVVPIAYGLPSTELEDRARRGEINLGGCLVSGDQPTMYCGACHSEWRAARDNRRTEISHQFARQFAHWNIELPPGVETATGRGTIRKGGWNIRYFFGDDGEKFLEFYASHRMTSDRRLRLYESGRTEEKPALMEMLFFDSNRPGDEERARREFDEHNGRVTLELRELGLLPEGTRGRFS